MGVYNKERRASLQRQGLTDRDRLRGEGARVPIGTRIAQAAATPQWGSLSSEGISDDALLVSDFAPWSQESYDKYHPDVQKNEARRKQALIIEKFVKAGKQHTLYFGMIYGKGHCKERLDCIADLGRVRDDRPELFTVEFVAESFGEMDFQYLSQIKEGARKVIMLGADNARKPNFARIALRRMDGKGARWEYPTTCLMRHSAGWWLSRIIPKLEEKVSRSAWASVLESSKIKDRDKKAGSAPLQDVVAPKKLYPAGKPLRLEESEMSKHHRPKSMATGEYLLRDYSTHAGCTEKNTDRTKGTHELMSTFGLHGSILAQLARRGGHRSGRKIRPEADGYLQAIRDGMAQEALVGKKIPTIFKGQPAGVLHQSDQSPKKTNGEGEWYRRRRHAIGRKT